ncbi:MAG: hypothetical protein GOV02_00900, partial [Candidatus Aenigmarchaeota archaeon]|nr:hypothetical protein [Candidatus Aenigmarchaeota archaeon]
MQALFGATGLTINLTAEDNQEIDNGYGYKAKCIVNEYKNPKVFLYVVDNIEKNECPEEPGFHMQCWPPNVSARNSTKIFVYISKENWHKLTTEYSSEDGGGFFGSRCKYDRCHFSYRDENMSQ